MKTRDISTKTGGHEYVSAFYKPPLLVRLPLALAMGAPLGVAQAVVSLYGADIHVETALDVVAFNGACSLREAIISANANVAPNPDCESGIASLYGDNILFDLPDGSTITLDWNGGLPLDITERLIIGNPTTGSHIIITGGNGIDTLMHLNPAAAQNLTLQNLTFKNLSSTANGGAIRASLGNLFVDAVNFENNQTTAYGGAIYLADQTSATISNSRFLANKGGRGGAIYGTGAAITLSGVEIDGNSATNNYGGGVSVGFGSLTMKQSSVVNNTVSDVAQAFGAGVYAYGAAVNMDNVTVANNSGGVAAGIYLTLSSGGLANVTVAGNHATVASTNGAGLKVIANSDGFTIRNSIVSGNTDSAGNELNCLLEAVTDGGYNLETTTDGCFTDATSRAAISAADAGLGTLGQRGGTVQSVNLLGNSVAIDAGNPDGCLAMDGTLLTQDARNATAVRSADGDGNGTKLCDIGAYEFGALGAIKMALTKSSTVEGDADPSVILSRLGELVAVDVSVQPMTGTGTAVAGEDFDGFIMGAGWTADADLTVTLPVRVFDDAIIEENETFYVQLTARDTSPGLDLIDSDLEVTIVDNDLLVSVDPSNSSVTMDENNTVTSYKVRVVMNAPYTSTVTVPYTTGGTATRGADFAVTTPVKTFISIPAGVTTFDVALAPINDQLVESDETIIVTLGEPSIGKLGVTSSHTMTLYSEDVVPTLTAPTSTVQVDEDATTDIPYVVSDGDGDTVTVTIKSGPLHGGASLIIKDKLIRYTPALNYNGSDSLVLTLSDGANAVDYTVNINVNPVNDAPQINEGDYGVFIISEDGSPTPFAPLTLTATDVDDDPLSWSVSAAVNGGVASVINGVVNYTPAANFVGDDSFTVTVDDGSGISDTYTVDVTVTAVNDAPQALNDTVITDEDTPVTFNVLDNDFDTEYETLTVITGNMTLASGASVVWNGAGSFTYTPVANASGSDSFNYTIRDSSGGESTATVTITINARNDAPVITEGATSSRTMSEDSSPLPFALTLHATDVDGDTLLWGAAGATHGVASVNGGVVSYSPNANYYGSDSFIVTVSDGKGGSASNTVTVTVVAVNDAPQAVNDSDTINEDTQYDPVFDLMSGINVVGNDLDVDGDTLYLLSSDSTTALGGTVMRHIDDTLSYFPAPNFHGSDSFSYTVSDGKGGQAVGTVVITVTPANDAPSLTLSASTLEVVVGNSVSLDVTVIDVDSGDNATITAKSVDGLGVVTVIGNRVSYAASEDGSDTVQITVTDAGGLTATRTASVTVAPAPVAASGGGGGAISWLVLLLGAVPLMRRRSA